MLTQDEVRHIAKLARIQVTDEKLEQYASELSNILDFFKDLEEVNTNDVIETSQVTGLESVTRPDVIVPSKIEKELLECTPHTVEEGMVRLPNIM